MKNFIKSLSLIFILSTVLFSCKTASVMKRHYNKGYYVSKKHNVPEVKPSEKITQVKPVLDIDKPVETVKLNSPEPVKDVVMKEDPLVTKENKDAKVHQDVPAPIANGFKPLKDPFGTMNKIPRELKNTLKQDDVARDALSLLWIVIVVLLIVYLLGLFFDLFGLGPVFHVLAAVILVLLILWLLRII